MPTSRELVASGPKSSCVRLQAAKLRATVRMRSASRTDGNLLNAGFSAKTCIRDDNLRFLINLFRDRFFPSMTGPEEKEDTARFGPPFSAGGKSPDASVKSRETVRIQSPVREDRDVACNHFFQPLNPSSAAQVTSPSGSVPLEPKKETARVSPALVPQPAVVQLKNDQPFRPLPDIASLHNPMASVAPAEKTSMLLCWILLAVSALILIIQVWTYLS